MGFEKYDEAERKRRAAIGGRAAHERGTAHEWTTAEARAAGRKGGAVSRRVRAAKRAEKEKQTA